MDTQKINQILRISKMYYELDLGQVEIAAKEGISKSTVSRLLKTGKEMGLIEVRIKKTALSFGDLEAEFLSRFPIRRITIVPDLLNNPQVILHDACVAVAEALPGYLEDDGILGVAWGSTLELLSNVLKSVKRKGVSVIQLSGGYSRVIHESSAVTILRHFAQNLNANAYVIPAPAVVDTPFIAEAIMQDSQIKKVLDMAERCQTAVFSVGNLSRPSVIYEMGLLSDEQYRIMEANGCVGDVCSHFINAQGESFDPIFEKRVVGASLDTIRAIPNKLVIACGVQKTKVILAALRGGLVDHLFIDEPTAMRISQSLLD